MATVKVCDRCGTLAVAGDLASTTKSFVVPSADPSTVTTADDFEIQIGMQSGKDLCGVCQASALVEYALVRLAAVLTPDRLTAWSTRINAALGIVS